MSTSVRIALALALAPFAALAQDPPPAHPRPPRAAEYDYIVVGSGVGGSIVASRLAEQGHTVLLVEQGGAQPSATTKVPAFHAQASEDAPVALDYGAKHYGDDAQAKRDPKYDPKLGGVLYPRGEGIGGSSIVNAMITVLPAKGDFDRIAEQTGDPSWSDENMLRYWRERIERNRYRPMLRAADRVGKLLGIPQLQNIGQHGFDGWLEVTRPPASFVISSALRDGQIRRLASAAMTESAKRPGEGRLDVAGDMAAQLANGFDINDWRVMSEHPEGIAITPLAVDEKGRRTGPRDLLLKVQAEHPGRIDVVTETVATKILFDANRKATGIAFAQGENLLRVDDQPRGPIVREGTVAARKGVVLSAGTFGTPQVLKLSGIGPEAELRTHGIDVLVDAPDVGRNLHDRYEVGIVSEVKDAFRLLEGATFTADPKDPHYQRWLEGKFGIYSTNGVVIAALKKSNPSLAKPDLYIFGVPGNFSGYYQGYSKDTLANRNTFTWVVLKSHSDNRGGEVTLRSNSPFDAPDINFRYFGEGTDAAGRDANAVLEGVKFARAVNARSGVVTGEKLPGPGAKTDAELIQWIKDVAWGHHATGTAAIGKVVDSRLRVKGTSGLYVVDASIFPDIPGYFIWTPLAMAAEKASDTIHEDAMPTGARRTGAFDVARREATGAGLFAAAYLVKEAMSAIETGDPARMKHAAGELATVGFWGDLAAFSVAARVGDGVLGRVGAGKLARHALPLAMGMAAVQLIHGQLSWKDVAIDTASFLAAGAIVNPIADGLIYPALFAAGPPGWIAAGAYTVGKLALTLYGAEKIGGFLRGLFDGRGGLESVGTPVEREGVKQKLDRLP